MFLERLHIKNFRGIRELSVHFNKGLNVLIGENNSGKTAIIDALRLCLGHGALRRDLYVLPSDFHLEKDRPCDPATEMEFHLHFSIEDPKEAAWFYDLLNTDEQGQQDIRLHLRFYTQGRGQAKRIKFKVWGGANEGGVISPEVLSLLYHVYLGALRDAEQYLRPTRGSKLGQLFSNLQIDTTSVEADNKKKQEIANRVHSAVHQDVEWTSHLAKGKEKINEHLQQSSFSEEQQQIDIDFLPFDFVKLVENLKIQTPVYPENTLGGDPSKQRHFELYQNGLGYNNLIYTAIVLGDLKQRKEIEPESYVALLLEEPEAHLHPQLQNLFFNYLNKLGKEEGFQVFITSHSPTITAKADLSAVIVLQNQSSGISCLPLTETGLSTENMKYLHKFLDVTKAQLFFSRGVILVEGISEALLMKICSTKMGEDYNIERAGIEIVNINGVAFEHFGKLFNSETEDKNLQTRCAIITDDDRNTATEEISSRANSALSLARKNLQVFLAERTFEYELFIAGNREILLSIFDEMHHTAAAKIETNDDPRIHAANFLEKVKSNKAKSELAHRLALKLSTDREALDRFFVPEYIQRAIKFVVG